MEKLQVNKNFIFDFRCDHLDLIFDGRIENYTKFQSGKYHFIFDIILGNFTFWSYVLNWSLKYGGVVSWFTSYQVFDIFLGTSNKLNTFHHKNFSSPLLSDLKNFRAHFLT